MNNDELRRARALYLALPETDKAVVRGLASRLRATGLLPTLEWLETRTKGGQALGRALREDLSRAIPPVPGVPRPPLDGLDNLSFLDTLRRAHALVEALHLVDRVERRSP